MRFLSILLRDEAGVIEKIAPGPSVFAVGPGDTDGIDMRAVDLILRAGTGSIDERARPAGYGLMVIGLLGLVLSLIVDRGGGPRNPNSQPPAPRRGRNASQR